MASMAMAGSSLPGGYTLAHAVDLRRPIRRPIRRRLTAAVSQASDTVTHRWTVYLKGANNEDISHIVQKVGADCRALV
jgi:hypothetical protein